MNNGNPFSECFFVSHFTLCTLLLLLLLLLCAICYNNVAICNVQNVCVCASARAMTTAWRGPTVVCSHAIWKIERLCPLCVWTITGKMSNWKTNANDANVANENWDRAEDQWMGKLSATFTFTQCSLHSVRHSQLNEISFNSMLTLESCLNVILWQSMTNESNITTWSVVARRSSVVCRRST